MEALAFDLGGTHLRAALIDTSGALSDVRCRRIQSVATQTPAAEIWDSILGWMSEYEAAHAARLTTEAPIVVAFPGPVADRSRILQAPTVIGSSSTIPDIKRELEERTGRVVHLINDVAAAAWYFGDATNANRFLVVTVSSGIGSKVFDRCHALRVLDDPDYSGEIGHVMVDDREGAIQCDCGGRGHLGAIASGRGIERTARLRAAKEAPAFSGSYIVKKLGGTSENLTNEDHLVPAALAGDAWAKSVIRDCTRPLARTILSVVMALGLDRVFVIGGFAQAFGGEYLEMLRCLMVDSSGYAVIEDRLPSIVEIGAKNEEACLKGCAMFLRHLQAPK
jgi:predicted NBD/HSP70 family sugar kinase